MQDLSVSFVQTSLHWEDKEANLKMFTEKISALREPTDLIILPEMFSTGFTMNPAPLAEEMNGATLNWMKKIAADKKSVLTGSFIAKDGEHYLNRLIWMRPDGTYDKYDKRHLFRYANEQEHYAGGDKKLIAELKGWKICPMVCYDLRFPVWSRNRINMQNSKINSDYDVLIFVANWPERRSHPWKTLLMARAIENQAYVVGVNRVGDDGNKVYHSGDSAVIHPQGHLISKTAAGEEKAETVQLSADELKGWREKFPAWMDADDFHLGG